MWPLFSLMSDCEAYSRQLGVTAGTEGVSSLSPPPPHSPLCAKYPGLVLLVAVTVWTPGQLIAAD